MLLAGERGRAAVEPAARCSRPSLLPLPCPRAQVCIDDYCGGCNALCKPADEAVTTAEGVYAIPRVLPIALPLTPPPPEDGADALCPFPVRCFDPCYPGRCGPGRVCITDTCHGQCAFTCHLKSEPKRAERARPAKNLPARARPELLPRARPVPLKARRAGAP